MLAGPSNMFLSLPMWLIQIGDARVKRDTRTRMDGYHALKVAKYPRLDGLVGEARGREDNGSQILCT